LIINNVDQIYPLPGKPSNLSNSVVKLGSLEQLDILCLTYTPEKLSQIELAPPSVATVRRLFDAYRHAFYNYTEHFIMYYLYKREQVRATYTVKELLEVVGITQEHNISKAPHHLTT
jgi:hypothetical protein